MIPAAALILAAYTGTLELSDRSEVRFRHAVSDPNGVSSDVVNVPSARMSLTDRRWEYTLSYAPLLALSNVQLGLNPEVLHAGSTSISWRDRRVRLSLREDASYGRQNTAYLTAFQPTPGTAPSNNVQGLPTVTSITFGSSRTTLESALTLARRWRATLAIGYFVFGGLDEESRSVVALQKGPRASASLTYAPSRIDDVTTAVEAQSNDTSSTLCPPFVDTAAAPPAGRCAPESGLVVATEVWRHSLSRLSETTLAAGASYLRTRLNPEGDYTVRLLPAATASYGYRSALEGRRAALRLEASVGPVIDLRTGIGDYRLQTIAVAATTHRRVTFAVTGGAARSLGSVLMSPATILSVGADVEYAFTRNWSVGAGGRYVWQHQESTTSPPPGAPLPVNTIASEYASVSLTYRATALRF